MCEMQCSCEKYSHIWATENTSKQCWYEYWRNTWSIYKRIGIILETVEQEHAGLKWKSSKSHALQILQGLVSFVITMLTLLHYLSWGINHPNWFCLSSKTNIHGKVKMSCKGVGNAEKNRSKSRSSFAFSHPVLDATSESQKQVCSQIL